MTLIEEKHTELMAYINHLCVRWSVDKVKTQDVQQEVMFRLLVEDGEEAFRDARKLWGRATNVARECIADTFAASLPLSGVSRQAHNAARRYLQDNDNDPNKAYVNQNNTDRVSRELLRLVASWGLIAAGAGDFQKSEPFEGLTEQDEASIMTAVNGLPDVEREVVRLYVWGDDDGRLTLRQVSTKLGFSMSKTKSAWSRARRRLALELDWQR